MSPKFGGKDAKSHQKFKTSIQEEQHAAAATLLVMLMLVLLLVKMWWCYISKNQEHISLSITYDVTTVL